MPETEPRSLTELDTAQGLARVSHDTELYVELLEMFADLYRPFAATLQAMVERGDRAEVVHALHTLKGAAGNVAAERLSQQAGHVVEILRAQPETAAFSLDRDEMTTLLRSLDRVLADIERYQQNVEIV